LLRELFAREEKLEEGEGSALKSEFDPKTSLMQWLFSDDDLPRGLGKYFRNVNKTTRRFIGSHRVSAEVVVQAAWVDERGRNGIASSCC
jgi:hypothetical protein